MKNQVSTGGTELLLDKPGTERNRINTVYSVSPVQENIARDPELEH